MRTIGGKKRILYIINNVKVCRSDDFSCKGFFAFIKNPKILPFSENPQTIPLILKKMKIFGIQRKLRVAAAVGKWYNKL